MYLYKKNKKKFAPVSKRYARKARIRKIAVILTLLAFAEGAFLFWREGAYFWENFQLPPALTWQIKEITIIAPSENLQKDIETNLKIKQIKKQTSLSAKEAKNLEKTLNDNIEQAKKIIVKRKFFTKELLITAEKYTPLAKITTPENDFFVSEEGIIFQDDEKNLKGGFLNISLNAKIESESLSKELVQFIKELKNSSLRQSDSVTIDFAGQTAQFNTPLGLVKFKNFEDVKEQFFVLTEILKIAKEKDLPQPYFVDFSYFDKGKVYLKQTYKDL